MSSGEEPQPLTASESALLRRDGEFMMEHAIALMSEAFVWGVYFLIVCSYTYAFPKSELRTSRIRLGAYLAILSMFFLATACFGIDIYYFSYQVNHVHLSETLEGQSLDDKFAAIKNFIGINRFLSSLLFYLEFFIIDAYLIWRAWLLVDGNTKQKRAKLAPTFVLWTANWFLLIAECITAGVSNQVYEQRMSGASRHLQTTIFVLFYFINLYCTFLILTSARAYYTSPHVSQNPKLKAEKHSFQKVGNLLIESGTLTAIYYTIQLGWFFTDRAYTPWFLYITAWSYTGPQIGGLNATLVASIVEHHYTFWDNIKPRSPEKDTRKKVSTIRFGTNNNAGGAGQNRRKSVSWWQRSKSHNNARGETTTEDYDGTTDSDYMHGRTTQFSVGGGTSGGGVGLNTTRSVITTHELAHAPSRNGSESEKVVSSGDITAIGSEKRDEL